MLAGCVARLEPAKDHGTLLQAMALLRARLPERSHLVVIGGGSQQDRAAAHARASSASATASTSPASARDCRRVAQSLDLSVLSSVKEGLSNTVLESMAAGPRGRRDRRRRQRRGDPPRARPDSWSRRASPAALARRPRGGSPVARPADARSDTLGASAWTALFSVDRWCAATEPLYLELVGCRTRERAA